MSGRMDYIEELKETKQPGDLKRETLTDAQELVYSAISQYDENDLK